jgi:hypothetical protein
LVEPVEQRTAEPDTGDVSGAIISIDSPNINPEMETDIILNLRVENAADLANAFLFLNFDPSALQVKDVQGAW